MSRIRYKLQNSASRLGKDETQSCRKSGMKVEKDTLPIFTVK
jgi:hypothetical protein